MPEPASGSPDSTAAPAASDADPARERAIGGVYAFTAYLIWGFLPLYFLLLMPTGPWELVAWRIVLSLGFCLILLTVMRGWTQLIMREESKPNPDTERVRHYAANIDASITALDREIERHHGPARTHTDTDQMPV